MSPQRFHGAATALRSGAWVSVAFLVAGLIDAVLAPDLPVVIRPGAIGAAVRGILRLDTGSLLHLGLLALLLTPIVRLLAATATFVRRRDTTFALLALGVLLLLGASVWIGLH